MKTVSTTQILKTSLIISKLAKGPFKSLFHKAVDKSMDSIIDFVIKMDPEDIMVLVNTWGPIIEQAQHAFEETRPQMGRVVTAFGTMVRKNSQWDEFEVAEEKEVAEKLFDELEDVYKD